MQNICEMKNRCDDRLHEDKYLLITKCKEIKGSINISRA